MWVSRVQKFLASVHETQLSLNVTGEQQVFQKPTPFRSWVGPKTKKSRASHPQVVFIGGCHPQRFLIFINEKHNRP